ncbi:hypothetical protein BHE97_16035 [Aeromicrobium sp. PE09-221]|uniref:hypothetical protein n=1 Tax=Aeromicrobium sp. PE09-221 TaxID=1898043 RepID=UPI000B3E47E6|nr:hypothetical protein [Aeromicrobium sp. PE09-221]OUZ07613.1 hypothetical protein BHE97_16035 [Aeromicrobium sp. PE09-221]
MKLGFRRVMAVAAMLTGLAATAACTGGSEEPDAASESRQSADRVLPLPELPTFAEDLSIGQSIDVIVDVPDTHWTVSSQDDSVLAAEVPAPEDGPSVIRLDAVGAGTTVVVFESEPDLRVEHEFTVVSQD